MQTTWWERLIAILLKPIPRYMTTQPHSDADAAQIGPETEHAVRVTIELPAALQPAQYERLVEAERTAAKPAQIGAGE